MAKLPVEDLLKLIEPGGPLSEKVKNFEARDPQKRMMRAVLNAFNENQIALIEAGTGTGKSVAYLIPALLWAKENKERTVVSTNTITLQEQLLHKDIPLLLNTLHLDLKAVLVKGMGNYVCLRKLQDALEESLLLPKEEVDELEKIEKWNATTQDGSRSTLPFTPSYNTWDKVNCEADTCNQKKCPFYSKCHFFRARKNAEDAHLLIVNHHLLFADLSYRKETNGEAGLLPDFTRVILDEAHHIEDVATEFFANRLHHLGVLRLLSRLSSEKQNKAQGKLPALKQKLIVKNAPEIDRLIALLSLDLPALKLQLNRLLSQTFETYQSFLKETDKLRLLPKHKEDPFWKEEVIPQTKELLAELARYTQTILSVVRHVENLHDDELKEKTKGLLLDITAFSNRLAEAGELLKAFISDEEKENSVSWIEIQRFKSSTNVHLAEAKLDISKQLAEALFQMFPTTILCSATLTTNRAFTFFRKRLGITEELLPEKEVTESLFDASFDYQKQALFAIPVDIPDPNQPHFLNKVSSYIWEAIQSSRGNAFVLFTSYSMLKLCYNQLEQKLKEHRYLALRQGEQNRDQLLKTFREADYSVLFGTDSFWEGVDVAGDALRCVILVRLPFKPPTEPIIEARTELIAQQGGNPFLDYTVPNAIVKFKQGFGRLIRNKNDRGCVVCLDTRLLSKNYGKLFINSLPPCQQLFTPIETLQEKMREFYRTTYHLVKK